MAALQRQGTGGFVLSLSASKAKVPYVIDPRSPLFQQELGAPKQSHKALRKLLALKKEDEAEEEGEEIEQPDPASFTSDVVKAMAERWAKFNCSYKDETRGKFEKYAKRLGEPVSEESAVGPFAVLAPYFVASSTNDPWWEVSKQLFAATKTAVANLDPAKPCYRVVATESPEVLQSLLMSIDPPERICVWVSGLNEVNAGSDRLGEYASAIQIGATAEHTLFALYGGFFAILLRTVGLYGASHGIGYGEYRAWRELPTSGPPPARYYIPELHVYANVATATALWQEGLTHCDCEQCKGNSPSLLEYHDLMMHAVRSRTREVEAWTPLSLQDATKRLRSELADFRKRLLASSLGDVVMGDALKLCDPAASWVKALKSLQPGFDEL